MTAEIYNRTQVAERLGIGTATLRGWEKRGLLSPEISVRGHQGEVVVYSFEMLKRAALIRQLREHVPPYTFDEISDSLRDSDCLERNSDLIQSLLGEEEGGDT
ncbi:MerR family transcriptional regulator [Candidatus Gottesmanbacteria bacterium]|nr:MerR family transcriptional regulator [Candidatus Gottesmanbacteria bacterium]